MTFRLAIISTGGTIEKTYCALNGALINGSSVLDVLLSGLELPGVEIHRDRSATSIHWTWSSRIIRGSSARSAS